jgi:dTMP kinase
MDQGLFLCIEGSDGSGKGTQYALLAKRLTAKRHPFLAVDFPRYGKPSAELVEAYLHNEFGDATTLDPRLASLPYAIDRLAASGEITEALASGKTVLANRFAASNMAHQGAKFASRPERMRFFTWLARLEYEIMGIPEPDYHFILHLPAAIAQERIMQRATQDPGTKLPDAHEQDLAFLKRSEQTYLDLVEAFPDRFALITCMDGVHERTADEIHEEIWEKLRRLPHHG